MRPTTQHRPRTLNCDVSPPLPFFSSFDFSWFPDFVRVFFAVVDVGIGSLACDRVRRRYRRLSFIHCSVQVGDSFLSILTCASPLRQLVLSFFSRTSLRITAVLSPYCSYFFQLYQGCVISCKGIPGTRYQVSKWLWLLLCSPLRCCVFFFTVRWA